MKVTNKIISIVFLGFEEVLKHDELAKLEEYFLEGNDKFLELIKRADFNNLDNEKIENLNKAYELMRKSKNFLYIKKYVNLLFKLYEGRSAYILFKQDMFGLYTGIEILLEADIDKYIIVALYSYVLTFGHRGEKMYKDNYKIIYDICKEDKGSIIKALDYVEPFYRALLSSMYCSSVNDEKSKELIMTIV